LQAVYTTAGDAAKAAETAKCKQYNDRYDIPPGRFIAFAVEDSGALGPSAKAFQRAIATACGGTVNNIDGATAGSWRRIPSPSRSRSTTSTGASSPRGAALGGGLRATAAQTTKRH